MLYFMYVYYVYHIFGNVYNIQYFILIWSLAPMEKEALIFPNTTGLFINMYLSLDCGDGNGQKAPHTWSNGLIASNSEE